LSISVPDVSFLEVHAHSSSDLFIGLREALFEILFSYEIQWLRLGFEVIFGGIISAPVSQDKSNWKLILKAFICDRMLSDDEILDSFGRGKILSAASERNKQTEIKKHFILRFFSVVLFLDLARSHRIIGLPTLFRIEASVKSSKEAAVLFCRSFLRAEGDISRHLGALGVTLNFSQTYIHEFDYKVTSVEKDLRDGVRLCRLAEVLAGAHELAHELRVPAISRLQKLHNVGLAMVALEPRLGRCAASAREVVDGVADKTLALIWQLMYEFEISTLISTRTVLLEASNIRANADWRRSIYPSDIARTVPVGVAYRDDVGNIVSTITGDQYSYLATAAAADDTDLVSALTEWCDTVASQYGLSVLRLREDLADGKVLCLLVHYYHPMLLPVTSISKTSQDLKGLSPSVDEDRRALEGERKNVSLVKQASSALGGIPAILPKFDTRAPPDVKVLILFLSLLFSRLTESSQQVLAAIRIQRTVRATLLRGRDIVYTVYSPDLSVKVMTQERQMPKKTYASHQEPLFTLTLSKKQTSAMRIVAFLKAVVARKDRLRLELVIASRCRETSLRDLQQHVDQDMGPARLVATLMRQQTAAVKLQSMLRMVLAVRVFRHRQQVHKEGRITRGVCRLQV
jgi:abnormal spindle-like microcephaly-associated protein